MATPSFATAVVRWQAQHGRNSLPWQNTQDPYRVWLSEIMLQQTQVATVIGYFDRFLARCPTVADLAAASSDEVMGLWSGLGYYSRARNLHRCAQAVCQGLGRRQPSRPTPRHAGQTLPGIGRSTAAAIAALCCYSERVAIMDGNVKPRAQPRPGLRRRFGRGRQRTSALCGTLATDLAAAMPTPRATRPEGPRRHAALHPGPDGLGGHRLHQPQPGLRPAAPFDPGAKPVRASAKASDAERYPVQNPQAQAQQSEPVALVVAACRWCGVAEQAPHARCVGRLAVLSAV